MRTKLGKSKDHVKSSFNGRVEVRQLGCRGIDFFILIQGRSEPNQSTNDGITRTTTKNQRHVRWHSSNGQVKLIRHRRAYTRVPNGARTRAMGSSSREEEGSSRSTRRDDLTKKEGKQRTHCRLESFLLEDSEKSKLKGILIHVIVVEDVADGG